MASNKEIKVILSGEITEEIKKNYAKTLARALMCEKGKEFCKIILDILKGNKDRC